MVKAKKGSNDEDDKEKVAKWKKATESGIEGGKNKIRPNKEELSEKPDKGKQNRGGGVIMENRRKQTKLRETDNKAINSLTNQG